MLARISFDNSQKVSMDKLTQIEEFFADTVECSELVKEDDDGDYTTFYSWQHTFDKEEAEAPDSNKKLVYKTNMVQLQSGKEYIGNVSEFIRDFPDLKIKIRGIGKSTEANFSNMISMIQEAEQKFTRAIESFNEKIEFNQKCNVHIGNLGLLNINQLGYATDMCTEALQETLNQGWRILAVCPQPDQRRPDYVLGRFNGNEEQTEVKCFSF